MFKSYLKTTFRGLLNNRLYTFINVTGLSIGIACAIFIFMYIKNELSYDSFHVNSSNIYRVTSVQDNAGEINSIATTSPPLAATLKKDFPEIENVTRVGRWHADFKSGKDVFEEQNIYAADPSFLTVFTFPLIQGKFTSALLNPEAIVLTEKTAEKYFGKNWKTENVVGKTVSSKAGKSEFNFTVTGVLKNIPLNSSTQFDFLIPFSFLEKFDNAENQWAFSSYYTYIQTKKEANTNALAEKIKNHIATYGPNSSTLLQIQPLKDIYLNSHFAFNSELVSVGNMTYVKIFTVTGIIILLLACINFVNLSTARSIKRSKEVGLRKTIGASRGQLIFQFLSEALILCTIALILSGLLVEVFFPAFKILYGKDIQLKYDRSFFAGLSLLFLVTVLLSGFYPAFYLSSFQPLKVLKGVFVENKTKRFREAMILTQFTFSVVMIIAAMIISKQLKYLQSKDLGFDKSQLMYVRLKNPDVKKNYQLLKSDILQRADIAGITATTASMVDVSNSTNGIKWQDMKTDDDFLMTQMTVDEDFVKTMGMKIIQGRNFSKNFPADSMGYIINETAAKRMGMSDNAIDKKLTFWGVEGRVIGIVKDFNYQALTTTIQPMVLRYRPDEFHVNLIIKTKPDKIPATVTLVESLYKKYDTDGVFEYGFVDQGIDNLYKSQQGTGRIISSFTVLTILISCMGLFGLAAYTTEQRTKEIGIRKVLGASVASITSMLSKDFVRLVLIAIIIASPIAWFGSYKWLQDFAYRIDVDAWVFVAAGISAIMIALVTVSFQAIKAAIANPMKSLRTE
ncbi:ABC transporter permease [Segetibacter aerophilus]|uniref:ABC transporter permease n=1 Tax=Segetibacter aerophilus TaxID=670293 RepID=A0A512BBK4_9BACT|nr:ABC transporter permease [Segetibacter aerophilus]GEO09217.1 ABC transporter permease [Segetibacter aerophilus]